YTSATNVGLYLVSVVAARELGLIDDAEAHARVAASLETLTRLETWRGFLFNYYDTTTLDRTSAFVSFVDSSWLVAGLLVARQALPALAARCDALLAERDFAVFYDPALGRMLHGFYVDPLRRSPFHYGALYTEARIGSLLAIGRGDVPVHHWHA